MPEGDTIAHAANRIRPVQHLCLRFEGDLVLHPHLGMSGMWVVYEPGRRWSHSRARSWIVLRVLAAELDGERFLRRLRSDDPTRSIGDALRPRAIEPRLYGRAGRPCPRCGAPIVARGQGDADRTAYWCPGCQW